MSSGGPPSPAWRPAGLAAAGAAGEAVGAGAVRSGVCGSILAEVNAKRSDAKNENLLTTTKDLRPFRAVCKFRKKSVLRQ